MTKSTRLALLVCASLVATAFAGNALAAYNPELLVAQTGSADTTINVRVPITDDPTARVALLVPVSWVGNLAQAPGTTIGDVAAEANARAIAPEARLPLTGTIVAVAPQRSNPCTGRQPAAQWELRLTAAGQTLIIPAYVERGAPGFPSGTSASHTIIFCLAPQSQAQFQAKLIQARLSLRGVFSPPTTIDQYVWSGIFTPYVGTTAAVNPAGTREAQSLVRPRRSVSISVRQRGRAFTISGRVTEGGQAAAGVQVQIMRGGSSRRAGRYVLRVFATKRTSANGTFTHTIRFRARGWVQFRVRANAPGNNIADPAVMDQARSVACVNPKPATIAPAGCTNAKILGFRIQSAITRQYRIR